MQNLSWENAGKGFRAIKKQVAIIFGCFFHTNDSEFRLGKKFPLGLWGGGTNCKVSPSKSQRSDLNNAWSRLGHYCTGLCCAKMHTPALSAMGRQMLWGPWTILVAVFAQILTFKPIFKFHSFKKNGRPGCGPAPAPRGQTGSAHGGRRPAGAPRWRQRFF